MAYAEPHPGDIRIDPVQPLPSLAAWRMVARICASTRPPSKGAHGSTAATPQASRHGIKASNDRKKFASNMVRYSPCISRVPLLCKFSCQADMILIKLNPEFAEDPRCRQMQLFRPYCYPPDTTTRPVDVERRRFG